MASEKHDLPSLNEIEAWILFESNVDVAMSVENLVFACRDSFPHAPDEYIASMLKLVQERLKNRGEMKEAVKGMIDAEAEAIALLQS